MWYATTIWSLSGTYPFLALFILFNLSRKSNSILFYICENFHLSFVFLFLYVLVTLLSHIKIFFLYYTLHIPLSLYYRLTSQCLLALKNNFCLPLFRYLKFQSSRLFHILTFRLLLVYTNKNQFSHYHALSLFFQSFLISLTLKIFFFRLSYCCSNTDAAKAAEIDGINPFKKPVSLTLIVFSFKWSSVCILFDSALENIFLSL